MNKQLKKRLKNLEKQKKKGHDLYAPEVEKGKKVSPKVFYDITLNNFHFHIYQMICMINGIDEMKYVYSDRYNTFIVKNMTLHGLKKKSKLDWKNPKDINGATFRARFATLILFNIARNAHSIIKHFYKESEINEKKYDVYAEVLNELIVRVDLFISTYLNARYDYSDCLISMMELIAVASGDYEVIDKLKTIKDFINTEDAEDSGVMCNNITKLAYVLATNSLNVKKTPEYEEGINIKDYSSGLSQVGGLGYAILKRRNKDGVKPRFYSLFVEANPQIWLKYDVTEAPETVVGARALIYLSHVMGDKKVDKFVKNMLQF